MSRVEPKRQSVTPLAFDQDGSAVLFTASSEPWAANAQEGKLAVDVIETEKEIVVVCPMAGASAQDIDISIHKDLLTIRGYRPAPMDEEQSGAIVHTECFWGPFSRTIVLPAEVQEEKTHAEYRNGILMIHIQKKIVSKKIPVTIVED